MPDLPPPPSNYEPGSDPNSDTPAETADLRRVWADFARRNGGTFAESERAGLERASPGYTWRPVMHVPLLHSWTIDIVAVRQALLESWRKEKTSVKDWVAPGGDVSFDFTTTLSVRYRSKDGFTFGVSQGGTDSLTEMKRNVEMGAAIDFPGLRGIQIHTPNEDTARSVLRPRVIEALNNAVADGVPFDLHIEQGSRLFGLFRSRARMELRLRVGTLLNDLESLQTHTDLVREIFDGLRRADSVQEQVYSV